MKGASATVLALALGAAAAVGVLWMNDSPHLPAPHADSISYMTAAESLVETGSLRVPYSDWNAADSTAPLAHFPPGFSAAMAIPLALGLPTAGAALLVLALAGGLIVALAFATVGAAAGPLAAGTACLLLAATPPLVRLHTAVWSEPLFLALLLAFLFVMVRWPGRSFVHGLLAAAAVLVRYAGVALVLAAALWSLRAPGRWTDRGRRLGRSIVPTLAGLGLWWMLAGRGAGRIREPGLYEGLGTALRSVPGALAEWTLPAGGGAARPLVGTLLFALALGVGVAGHRRALGYADQGAREAFSSRAMARAARARLLLQVCALFAVCYAATLLVARLVADPLIPFDARLLAPIMLPVELCVVVAAALLWRGWPARSGPPAGRWGRLALVATAALWAGAGFLTIRDGVASIRDGGRLYTSALWRQSTVLEWIRTEGTPYRLYSNEPEMIFFHTGRSARRLPSYRNDRDLAAFAATYAERPGAVVVIPPLRPGEPAPVTVAESVGADPVLVEADGVVLVPRAGR